ncbi:MAG: glycosyltransferase [Oscillochloris sp.]|nr:glycosyltransferase [Oscillochloris sp.]
MSTAPLVSVVIPTYNRPQPLAACLQALAAQDYPRDRYEVIVVDDGSPQSPAPLFAALPEMTVRLIVQQRRGPAAARNAGAAVAHGRILAFTDDDCRPHPDWLRALSLRSASAPNALVGGAIRNALPDNPYADASQILVGYIYDYYNRPQGARFFTSNNIAMPREQFLAIGGFDAGYPRAAAEDRDFCDRWLDAGYPLLYAPEARIDHAHALDLRRFWRQHFNYGRGAYHFHRGRAVRNQQEIRVEPLRFYGNLLAAPLNNRPLNQALPRVGLLFLSQAANALGFFVERAVQAGGPAQSPLRRTGMQ